MRQVSAVIFYLRKANYYASEASKPSTGAIKTWCRVNKIASEASKTSPPQELAKFGAQRQFFASNNKLWNVYYNFLQKFLHLVHFEPQYSYK